MKTDACFTPLELADRWKCCVETVIAMILRGQLPAFNISKPGSQKPRWRITVQAVEQFEGTVKKEAKPRVRRRRDRNVIEFF